MTSTHFVTTDQATADRIHERRWWTLAVLCLSLLIIGMDNTILNVALPTIQRDLNASASSLQWIVDAYVIVYASILLTTGSLGDRFGRKGALNVGLVVFGLGSIAAAFAQTSGQLIAFRAVGGIGGALIMPATLSILINVFPVHERGRAIGIWAGVSGLGIVIGPLAGGWLLEHMWWGSVFLINVPVVIAALIAGHSLVPTSRDPHAPRLDLVGTVLGSAGLGTLLYGIIEAPAKGWGDSTVLLGFGAGITLIVAFLAWESHCDHPMLDIGFFRNRSFSGASFAITLVFFAMFGSMYFLTQYLQFVLGFSTIQAGAALIPLALTLMIAAPNSARLTRRFGTRATVSGGLTIVASALALMSRVTVDSGYPLIAAVLVLLGAGMGFAMSPATESIMSSVPANKSGVGSAMNDTTRQVGGALGIAILGSLTSSAYHDAIDSSPIASRLVGQSGAVVRDSIGGAHLVAEKVGDSAQPLLRVANAAFVDAMSSTVLIAAAVAVVGAIVAGIVLPARTIPVDDAVDDDPEHTDDSNTFDDAGAQLHGEPTNPDPDRDFAVSAGD